MMLFNINNYVRVKLTPIGHEVHKREWSRTNAMTGYKMGEYTPPEEDEEGWSKWQMWHLMRTFGGHVRNGAQVPFETEVDILFESSPISPSPTGGKDQ